MEGYTTRALCVHAHIQNSIPRNVTSFLFSLSLRSPRERSIDASFPFPESISSFIPTPLAYLQIQFNSDFFPFPETSISLPALNTLAINLPFSNTRSQPFLRLLRLIRAHESLDVVGVVMTVYEPRTL